MKMCMYACNCCGTVLSVCISCVLVCACGWVGVGVGVYEGDGERKCVCACNSEGVYERDCERECVCSRDMVWLRLVGSLKLYVSFAKEPYKRDDILQKRPIILRSLLLEATP